MRTLGAQNVIDHKTKRTGSALKFLTRYAKEDDDFLDSIVTGVFTIQATVTAMAPYAFPQNQKIQNFNFSEKKIMASLLWDRKYILLVDYMPPGSTGNAAAYCDT